MSGQPSRTCSAASVDVRARSSAARRDPVRSCSSAVRSVTTSEAGRCTAPKRLARKANTIKTPCHFWTQHLRKIYWDAGG